MGNGSRAARKDEPRGVGCQRILLVGFMGSGKSTVGPLLASHLDWSFFDFDREIERRAGAPVTQIFRERGELYFRELEAEVGRKALLAERAVLATGGGWAAAPGRIEALGPDTLVVWLRVSAETSLARAGGANGSRPLLAGPEPLGKARRLLEQREPWYGMAALHLDSELASADELARRIVEHVSGRGEKSPDR